MGQILSEGGPHPKGWDSPRLLAGLAIYRDGYRARLIDSLAETFPKTRLWVGTESFEQAAAHHLIVHPPRHWSLDLAGEDFDASLACLFARYPEVPELAALEWDMHRAFVSADAQPLDAQAFAAATAGFTPDDWDSLVFDLHPALSIRRSRTAAAAIWRALTEGREPPSEMLLHECTYLMVWREGTKPVFRSASPDEAECLQLIKRGGSFGEICLMFAASRVDEEAANVAGSLLAQWLGDGLVAGIGKRQLSSKSVVADDGATVRNPA